MAHESSAKLLQISEYSWKLFSWTYTLNGQTTVTKSNKAKETFWTTALDYISQFILHRPFHREDCLCTHCLQFHLMMHRYVKRHNVIFALERTLWKCPYSPSADIGHTHSWHAIIFTESHGLCRRVSDPKRRIPHYMYVVNECPVYDHMRSVAVTCLDSLLIITFMLLSIKATFLCVKLRGYIDYLSPLHCFWPVPLISDLYCNVSHS